MSEEQTRIYEELRQRAEALSEISPAEREIMQAQGIEVDSAFRIIREMDRVTTDLDLYNRTLTYVFPEDYLEQVKKLVDSLPNSIDVDVTDNTDNERKELSEKELKNKQDKIKKAHDKRVAKAKKKNIDISELDEDDFADDLPELTKVKHDVSLTINNGAVKLVINELFEPYIEQALIKLGIPENIINHPLAPKYALLIENLKSSLTKGKQLIFTEEKSQHKKLKRIIANNLGIDPKLIAIINADTVTGKGEDGETASLELIANKFNTGEHVILIANKKCEVGINLHHGTAAVHHLTLPWTPASIAQRNGRAARVGSTHATVDAFYYVGKGSFDEFRLKSLQHKASWINELFTSDADRLDNADAQNADENSLLLAKDAGERQARIAANQRKVEAKVKEALATRALIDLNNYIKSAHDLSSDTEQIRKERVNIESEISELTTEIDKRESSAAYHIKESLDSSNYNPKYDKKTATRYLKEAAALKKERGELSRNKTALDRKLKRVELAESQVKRLRDPIESAIKKGVIDVDMSILDDAKDYVTHNGRIFKAGKFYNFTEIGHHSNIDFIYELVSLNFDFKTAVIKQRFASCSYASRLNGKILEKPIPLGDLLSETAITESELEIKNRLQSSMTYGEAVNLLNIEQYHQFLGSGHLKINTSGIKSSRTESYVIETSTGFDFSASVSGYEFEDKHLANSVVYPDQNNTDLKKRLATWYLEYRKTETPKEITSLLNALFGSNYALLIEEYGNKATGAQVTKWSAQTLDAFKQTEDGKESFNTYKNSNYFRPYDFKTYFTRNIPLEFDNNLDFESEITRMVAAYDLELKETVNTLRKEKADLYIAAFKAASTTVNAERYQRISQLLQVIHSNHRLNDSAIDELSKGKYQEFGNAIKAAMLADVLLITGSVNNLSSISSSNNVDLALASELSVQIASIPAYIDYDLPIEEILENINSIMDAIVNGRESKAEESKEDIEAAESNRQTANIEATNKMDALATNDTYDGIIIKLNATEINLPKRKIYGRWKRAFKADVGDLIAMHDPKGKSGLLFDSKDDIKRISGWSYEVDLNDEFQGSWWFLPASIGIDKARKIIGV